MNYYVGVDGGGTKTHFVWTDEKGNVVLQKIRGSSNPNDIGKEQMIADMVAAFSQDMPADANRVCVCLGLSGMSFSGCQDELKQALSQNEKIQEIDICSDVQIALDGAYDGDGAIVIMGTGSVGYVRKDGKCRLIGGGGYMIDSSFSGYDVGREALNALLSQSDGRGEATLLTPLIIQSTGLQPKQIVREVYLNGKAYVASFAPFVFQGYEKGDKVCESILQRRISQFEPLLFGVYQAMGKERCEITLIGGLSRQWDVVYKFLSAEAKEKFIFKTLSVPVVYGAVKRAKKAVGKDFLDNFLKSCRK